MVDLNEHESFIMVNGVLIHERTIHWLFVLQHGFGYKYNLKDSDSIFENKGLERLKTRLCDLYSWIIKSNYLHGSNPNDYLPEKYETLLELIQEIENYLRDFSVPMNLPYWILKEYENTVRHERV